MDNSYAQHRPDGDAGRKLACLIVEIPAFYRWHLSGGIAYCHGDGSACAASRTVRSARDVPPPRRPARTSNPCAANSPSAPAA
ncbi:hypothetical protein [Streptomyces sp. NPDC060027]|uniref:hypothetical protein n=1 Tax=Streptomyces sp. NPDC060027 TaxID=3347040 RepID=UPI0036CCC2E6